MLTPEHCAEIAAKVHDVNARRKARTEAGQPLSSEEGGNPMAMAEVAEEEAMAIDANGGTTSDLFTMQQVKKQLRQEFL